MVATSSRCCCQAQAKAAEEIADRIRMEIECRNFDIGGGKERVAVTLSVGVAAIREGDSPESLLKRADRRCTNRNTPAAIKPTFRSMRNNSSKPAYNLASSSFAPPAHAERRRLPSRRFHHAHAH